MAIDLNDLSDFAAVVRAKGFRDAARVRRVSASRLSDAVRRLELGLGVRLLNRTTRSIAPTEAGLRLLERLEPALREVAAATDAVNAFRDTPAGTLRINVPVAVARLVLPTIVTPFLKAYPDIVLEVIAEDGFVDVLAEGCDAGIRYEERLEQDMIAVPIGPRIQRFAIAAAPGYLDRHGRPEHPRDLLAHACLRGPFAGGAPQVWELERDGPADRAVGRRRRTGDRRGGRWAGDYQNVRGMAAPRARQRRTGAGAGTLVAEFLRPVPLLSRPPPSAGPLAGVRGFHQALRDAARTRLTHGSPGFAI
jgi:DNA-binding transcriptional LysR family regulator